MQVRQLDVEIEDLKENVDFVDKIPEERIINLRVLLDKYSIDDLKQWDNILKKYKVNMQFSTNLDQIILFYVT